MSKSLNIVESVESKRKEYIQLKPHYLTRDALIIPRWPTAATPRYLISPPTPTSEFQLNVQSCHSFPNILPTIDALELPIVREKGVKFCIEHFGEYFGCSQYKTNLLQFWFLDIVTDCIWITQDDFQLPLDLQKLVLKWVLYFIDLLRDPHKNITRKEFFETFKEAILMASEIVEEGCNVIPPPDKLLTLIEYVQEPKSCNSTSSETTSCSSIEITQEDYETSNFVELGDGRRRKYLLHETTWKYSKLIDELSSIESFPESLATISESLEGEKDPNRKKKRSVKDVEFYQADPNVPARFLPLNEEALEEESINEGEEQDRQSVCQLKKKNSNDGGDEWEELGVKELSESFYVNSIGEASAHDEVESTTPSTSKDSVPSSTVLSQVDQKEVIVLKECRSKKQIMQDLAVQKIQEQRLLDMDDPKKGWVPTGSDVDEKTQKVEPVEPVEEDAESVSSEESETSVDKEWVNAILEQQKELTEDNDDRQVINYGVLRAIIDFIFKYFYESFQFTLIKLAFLGSPDMFTQKLNQEWAVPKRTRGELVRPKDPKPVKPPKPAKEKPEKIDKKAEKAEGKDKKEKEKEVKPKQEKPTKEELEELARLKKEQELLEEEMRKAEENKRFMFPLDDAATDELFMNIFDNWKRVPIGKKGK